MPSRTQCDRIIIVLVKINNDVIARGNHTGANAARNNNVHLVNAIATNGNHNEILVCTIGETNERIDSNNKRVGNSYGHARKLKCKT